MRRGLLAAGVSLGLFATALDSTVNVALPTLAEFFDTGLADLQWIIIAFVATSTALSIGVGAAGDRFGLQRFFRAGLVLYAAAMVLIAIAPSLQVLVAIRVVQGVGAAAVMAVGPALVARAYPPGERGRILGVVAGVQAAGLVASGFAGGVLIEVFGWQSIFLGRLPFLGTAFLLALLAMRELDEAVPAPGAGRPTFDLGGAAALFVAVGALLVGLNLVRSAVGPLPALALIVAAGAATAAFVYLERRAVSPVLDLALLRAWPFSAALAALLLNSFGVFTIWFIFPFFVADVLGQDAGALGLLLGVQGLAMALAAPVGGRLADRVPPARVMAAAGFTVAAGLAWVSQMSAGTNLVMAGLPLLLTGAGQGALGPAARTLAFNHVPHEQFGSVSGALNLARSMGLVLSVACFAALFSIRQETHLAGLLAEGLTEAAAALPAHLAAFRDTFMLAALATLAGAACSLLAWRGAPRPAEPAPGAR